jgi:hypothetical protein
MAAWSVIGPCLLLGGSKILVRSSGFQNDLMYDDRCGRHHWHHQSDSGLLGNSKILVSKLPRSGEINEWIWLQMLFVNDS